MEKQTLLLIDGNSILNRAYYALPPLNDKQGRNVNAVYGFCTLLFKALDEYKPEKLAVAFDKHGKNFRKELYPEYKANRKMMAEDLAVQIPVLHDLLRSLNITIVEKAGVEADDIIGTVSSRFNGNSLIISGDRDMFQLVSDKITVLFTKKGVTETEAVTPESLLKNYSLTPEQVIEYKALRGDTSDNIPGVRGVGEKTAMQLLEKYGDIDGLYAHLGEQKGSLREKLIECKDLAYLSKVLATIVKNADVECDLDACELPSISPKAKELLTELQFRTVLSRFSEEGERSGIGKKAEVTTVEISAVADLQAAVRRMEKAEYFAFHLDGNVAYLSDSASEQYKIYISDNFLDETNEQTVFDELRPLLSGGVPKAVYDNKSLRHVLEGMDVSLENVKYDLSLMQYLVEYRAYKDVVALCEAYDYGELGSGVFYVAQKLCGSLEELGVEKLYFDVELPLSDLLYRMEKEGVKVDTELLDKMSADLRVQLAALKEEIWALAGEKFNVNSAMQLSNILFDKLALPHGKKTHRDYYTTNNEVLEKIADKHPIVNKILEHRKIAKLLNTYVDGLRPLVKKGLVHTTFNQALTSTGRLSSSDPNLQNIPIRNEQGKEIRKLFRSKYGVFVGADYSQIELRMLAAFSKDENLLNCFINGEDIHTRVASELLGVPAELVNKSMRRTAKAVNFGIIYGISDFGLSQNAGISVARAREYIATYFARFPKIKAYLDSSVAQAKTTGYVTTLTGRRRQIPEIKSTNYNLRMFGERAAMNMPLQGTAADIMKIAMLKVDAAMKKEKLKSRIVLQIHDELIVDCYLDETEKVKAILKEQMEHAVKLDCPLTVETETGETLYDA